MKKISKNIKSAPKTTKALYERPAWVKLGDKHTIKGYANKYMDAYNGGLMNV